MAGRQFKQGLDYFPLDISFFNCNKIQLIETEFGIKGILVALRLLCKIYANGYFYQWGKDECVLLSKAAGAEFVPGAVNEMVNGLVRRRFFDKGCFDRFGILTSQSIQQVYLEASERRKSIDIIAEYWLLELPTAQNVNIYSINVDINEQRKEKVKGNKTKLSVAAEADPSQKVQESPEKDDDDCERLNYEDLVNLFNEQTKGAFGIIRMPLNENRKKSIRARIREFGIASFEEMIRAATRSSFLKGQNKRGFKATFDWMIRPSNYQKILEGNYETTKNQAYGANRGNYTTISERVRSESDILRQELAAKYQEG